MVHYIKNCTLFPHKKCFIRERYTNNLTETLTVAKQTGPLYLLLLLPA